MAPINFTMDNNVLYLKDGTNKTKVDTNDDGVISIAEMKAAGIGEAQAKAIFSKFGGDNFMTSQAELWTGLNSLAGDTDGDNDVSVDQAKLDALGAQAAPTNSTGEYQNGVIYQDGGTLKYVTPNGTPGKSTYAHMAKRINEELYGGNADEAQLEAHLKSYMDANGMGAGQWPKANTEVDLKAALAGFSSAQVAIFDDLSEQIDAPDPAPDPDPDPTPDPAPEEPTSWLDKLLNKLFKGNAKKQKNVGLLAIGIGLAGIFGLFDNLFGSNQQQGYSNFM